MTTPMDSTISVNRPNLAVLGCMRPVYTRPRRAARRGSVAKWRHMCDDIGFVLACGPDVPQA